MSLHQDFDAFLAAQRARQAEHGNLTDRKTKWLGKIDQLHDQIVKLLAPYTRAGSLSIERTMSEVREEAIGTYLAPALTINLGSSSVQFMPVGTILLGCPGRVDLVGLRGRVRFVLATSGSDRPLSMGSSIFDGGTAYEARPPLDLTPFVWKISTLPPGIRYSVIDIHTLQAAIMEATNGNTIRR